MNLQPGAPCHKVLRNDLPFCVVAMLHFMHSGSYSWAAIPFDITSRYLRTTESDLHVHLYMTGVKYRAGVS